MSQAGVSVELAPDEESGRPAVRTAARNACELTSPAGYSDGVERPLELDRRVGDGLSGCLACGHPELYTQTDFPRGLGIAIVVVAAILAPFTSYISLAVAALIDAVLYKIAPDMLVCYACNARHRGFAPEPRHPHFDRTIEERLRYGEKAVMGAPMRPGGTAGAPEPEH